MEAEEPTWLKNNSRKPRRAKEKQLTAIISHQSIAIETSNYVEMEREMECKDMEPGLHGAGCTKV